jgi:hypothetical protein
MSTRFKQLLASLVECEDRVQRESIARQLEQEAEESLHALRFVTRLDYGPETVCEVR